MLVSNEVFPLLRKSFRFYLYFCNGENFGNLAIAILWFIVYNITGKIFIFQNT